MHRELRHLARELLTPVKAVERFRAIGRNPVADSLGLLGGLAELTRESLMPATRQPSVPPQAEAPAQAAVRPSLPAHPSLPGRASPAPYGTQRGEYRPALRDPSIVDALLALNRVTPTRAEAGPGRMSPADFASIEVPLVDASPKPIPPGTRHSPGRVLR